jgi:hypothetical protein
MVRKILLVTAAFYPENSPRSFRATELALELAKQGNFVKILTQEPSSDTIQFAKKNNLSLGSFGSRKFDNFLLGKSFWRRAVRKVLGLLFEFPDIEFFFLVRKALKFETGYDLMISFSVPYPVHWGCANSWKKGHTSNLWVADCGDPYMGVKYEKFNKPFYMMFVEKWMFRKVDFISITRISFLENYYKEFWPKIIEIPQGFNFESVEKAKYTKNEKVTFAFAGALSHQIRNPSKLLDYLYELRIDFEFLVYTRTKDVVMPYKKKLEGKLKIFDVIPREELIYELSKVDFLVNFEFDPLTQSPSKLIDYAIIGRPILSLSYSNFDTTSVDEFINGNYSKAFKVENIAQYKIENVAEKFLKLIN